METALRSCCRNVRIGKILIQRQESPDGAPTPKLYYSKLPPDIEKRRVLLLDPMLATGGTANMAVDVLKQHGVSESNIIFVSLFASPEGLRSVREKNKLVCLVTGQVDEGLNAKGYIYPGAGDFGDVRSLWLGSDSLFQCLFADF